MRKYLKSVLLIGTILTLLSGCYPSGEFYDNADEINVEDIPDVGIDVVFPAEYPSEFSKFAIRNKLWNKEKAEAALTAEKNITSSSEQPGQLIDGEKMFLYETDENEIIYFDSPNFSIIPAEEKFCRQDAVFYNPFGMYYFEHISDEPQELDFMSAVEAEAAAGKLLGALGISCLAKPEISAVTPEKLSRSEELLNRNCQDKSRDFYFLRYEVEYNGIPICANRVYSEFNQDYSSLSRYVEAVVDKNGLLCIDGRFITENEFEPSETLPVSITPENACHRLVKYLSSQDLSGLTTIKECRLTYIPDPKKDALHYTAAWEFICAVEDEDIGITMRRSYFVDIEKGAVL